MGGDSCCKGCEFESQHRMDRHTYFFKKINVFEKGENKLKRDWGCPIKKTKLPKLSFLSLRKENTT